MLTQHGRVRTDPYAWLRDDNWREVMREPGRLDPTIRGWLDAENRHTRDALEAPTAALQDALFDEMKARVKENDSSVPAIDGPWAYYRRFREGGEYPVFARRPAADAFAPDADSEQILVDGEELAKGREYLDIRKVMHSPDHRLVAYSFDDKGSEFYTIRIRDIATGRDLVDHIDGAYGDFVWGEDSASLYWIERDANARPVAVNRRRLGQSQDACIYREADPGFFVGIQKSQSHRFVFITVNDHATSEWRYFEATEAEPRLRLIAAREPNVLYSVADYDGGFLILNNADGAVDFRLSACDYGKTDRAHWRDVLPHRPGVLLIEVAPFANWLARLERADGLPRIVIREQASGAEHTIAFDAAAYALDILQGFRFDTPVLRFDYSSPCQPVQVFDYDMAARTRVLRKTQEVPSGHDPSNYIVERIEAPAADGALVPVTLLRRRTTPVDGSAPVLLYGYGAYGITIPADFRTARLSLVDRGFIYAIADVRGSMARGYQWYLDGKLAKKMNTFTDYVAAGRRLVELGYTQAGRVVGMGGSAGGMLMGAAVNIDPILFAGVIAAVPFVDVLNTMSDESLPLTPPEWPEWGDPLRDEQAYDRIAAYSPYEQTSPKPYPPMLITGGLTDPRVTYWEPAKWVAKLRHEAPMAGPYFLRINMDAGHGGVSGRFASMRETALEFAFALACVGKAGEGFSLR